MEPPALVAVESAEEDDLDPNLPADGAGAGSPGSVLKDASVSLPVEGNAEEGGMLFKSGEDGDCLGFAGLEGAEGGEEEGERRGRRKWASVSRQRTGVAPSFSQSRKTGAPRTSPTCRATSSDGPVCGCRQC